MPTIYKRYEFIKAWITFNIPVTVPQLQAVSKPIGVVPMSKTRNFAPIRIVDNIAIEQVGKPGKFLTRLPRKVRINVHYDADVFALAMGKPLVLAIWDGKDWVLLNDPKYHYKLVAYKNPARGGYAKLTTNQWWDPPMVWGT